MRVMREQVKQAPWWNAITAYQLQGCNRQRAEDGRPAVRNMRKRHLAALSSAAKRKSSLSHGRCRRWGRQSMSRG